MSKKILIIEDENFLLDMYRMKFEKEGYKVYASLTGAEGVSIAQKEKPDLILLDLVMPKMDGYQVLKKLKTDKGTKDIKIYILSNLGQDGEIVKGFDEGANGFLIKANLTPGQLIDDVKKIFAGKSAGLKRPTTKLPKISGDKKRQPRPVL